jgi:hypothetical protein
MKRLIIVQLAFILLFCLFSCKTQPFPYSKEKRKQLQEFRETLNKTKEQAKQYLVNSINESPELNWLEKYCKVKFTNDDVPAMTIETIPVYRIDSIAFWHCRNISDVVKNMTLETRNANFYLRKDSIFISDFRAVLRDNEWKSGGGFCGIYPNLSKKFQFLYSHGFPIYNVKVFFTTTRAHYYDMPDCSYNVYDNGKELIIIKINGSETPFIQELENQRNYSRPYYMKHS